MNDTLHHSDTLPAAYFVLKRDTASEVDGEMSPHDGEALEEHFADLVTKGP